METTTPIRPLQEKSTEKLVGGDVVGDRRKRKIDVTLKGVTLEGMYLFLEEIGFVEWRLPELWPSVWAQRRRIPQRERTLKLQHAEDIVICSECFRNIAVGELAYVERISGFHETCLRLKEEHSKRCDSLGWRYVETYELGATRRTKIPWLQMPKPKIDEVHGLRNMTGYDLIAFVKEWLLREGLAHLSIAEVMLTESRFAHLRKHVGIATIFWSHSNLEPVIDHCTGTLVRIREAREKYQRQLPPVNDQFWWVDYFCLRQGVDHDFVIDEMIGLIQRIPYFVCSLQCGYLSNSFCLLEMFSAMTREKDWQYFGEDCKALAVTVGVGMNLRPILASKQIAGIGELSLPEIRRIMAFLSNDGAERLICYGPGRDRDETECQLAPHCPSVNFFNRANRWVGPVNSEMAQTRSRLDKNTIDDYIRDSVGFQEFDERITKALLHGSYCGKHQRVCCQKCPPFYSHPCRQHERAYCQDCFSKLEFEEFGTRTIKCVEHKKTRCSLCY
jgi:hypothetical protein